MESKYVTETLYYALSITNIDRIGKVIPAKQLSAINGIKETVEFTGEQVKFGNIVFNCPIKQLSTHIIYLIAGKDVQTVIRILQELVLTLQNEDNVENLLLL